MNQHPGTTPETPTEVRCMRCKRVLTEKYSVRRGYGRGCQAKLREATQKLTKIYTRAQIKKAADALRAGTIRFIGDGKYACDSSNQKDTYVTTAYTCTCPSRIRCYHQCGVMVRELTPLHRH